MTPHHRIADPNARREHGIAMRAKLVELCEQAIASGVPLPRLAELAAQCGAPSVHALNKQIGNLYASGVLVRVPPKNDSAASVVIRMRDRRFTPREPAPAPDAV